MLAVIALTMAGIALVLSPIAQPQAYHSFAEQRTLLGIPHFGDVVTNIAYVIVAVLGFVFLVSRDGKTVLAGYQERLPYFVFFAGVGAIAVGSVYYHADPTNQTLLWDRLPMVVAFTAILAAFVADRIHTRAGALVVLPLAVAMGVVSLVYWHISEAAGRGDLRFYFLVQATAIVLIPLICVLFRGRLPLNCRRELLGCGGLHLFLGRVPDCRFALLQFLLGPLGRCSRIFTNVVEFRLLFGNRRRLFVIEVCS